jgi:hypothetical protein
VARVVARGGTLKEAWDAVRAECDPKFKDFAIYEHCLPFNVARAFDEARGIDTTDLDRGTRCGNVGAVAGLSNWEKWRHTG